MRRSRRHSRSYGSLNTEQCKVCPEELLVLLSLDKHMRLVVEDYDIIDQAFLEVRIYQYILPATLRFAPIVPSFPP